MRAKDPAVATLARSIEARTVEAARELYTREEGGRVRCVACGHRCLILDGLDGICRVRFNRGGVLLAPRGYVAALQVDPIEKKPFFHVLPGSAALSFGMLGCDYHCGYCQNWLTSQALRDPAARAPIEELEPDELVALAKARACPVVVSTYNEPLITSEWAVEVFTRAKQAGLVCGYVSNGNATPEVLAYLRPWVALYKVDLKGFRDIAYRSLGGVLRNVLDTIATLHREGFWVEIVTLLIPGFNDSPEEVRDLSAFLASVSPDLPWHVTAFHPDYKMNELPATTAAALIRAAEIGKQAGLRYVYAGNLPGRVAELENTICPCCGAAVVERHGYRVGAVRLTRAGDCAACGTRIPGLWFAA